MKILLKTISKLGDQIIAQLLIATIMLRRVVNKKPELFIIGNPLHGNIGDQAIYVSEVDFLKNYFPNHRIVILNFALATRTNIVRRLVRNTDILLCHGGGNMGDLYPVEEKFRQAICSKYASNKIVIFPQTIGFHKDKMLLKKSQKIYNTSSQLTIIAREEESFETMSLFFTTTNILLTPDIVLFRSHPASRSSLRNGVLLCFRGDKEKVLSGDLLDAVIHNLDKKSLKYSFVDTASRIPYSIIRYLPKRILVNKKLNQFSKAKLVITDRLHGMIFATITGTPCIAFDNLDGKVGKVYKSWLKKIPYVYYCKTGEDFDRAISKIDVDRHYTYDPSQFNEYWQKIADVIK